MSPDRGFMTAEAKTLLIASVFAPSSNNADWYRLQSAFVRETTDVAYDYQVLLNGADPKDFGGARIMRANRDNLGHSAALDQVLDHFRSHKYDAYLVLDSDCFPVRRGWYGVLTKQMQGFGKSGAAVVRTENLDVFPHPSAFFMLPEVLGDPRLDFRVSNRTRTLLGEEVSDVGGNMQSWDSLLPLLRTNLVNLHPVAAAVYHHLFYHHGGGSRAFTFRVLKRFRYYDHWYDTDRQDAHGEALYHALMKDPVRFIGRLMGEQQGLTDRLLALLCLRGRQDRLVRPFLKTPLR
jgi:hypothetical protein